MREVRGGDKAHARARKGRGSGTHRKRGRRRETAALGRTGRRKLEREVRKGRGGARGSVFIEGRARVGRRGAAGGGDRLLRSLAISSLRALMGADPVGQDSGATGACWRREEEGRRRGLPGSVVMRLAGPKRRLMLRGEKEAWQAGPGKETRKGNWI